MARYKVQSSDEIILNFIVELISDIIDTFNVNYSTAVQMLNKIGIWSKRNNKKEMLIWAHYGTDKVIERIKEQIR